MASSFRNHHAYVTDVFFSLVPRQGKRCPMRVILSRLQSWSSREYVVSIEVGLRSPLGPLREVVDWAKSNGRSMGFFAALGDIANE
jgi:hypothetical protein